MSESVISRRQALLGCAAACAAVPLLAACGSDGTSSGTPSSTPTTADPTGSASPSTSASSRPTTPALSSTSDIPEGGGKIFPSKNVIVTQPTAGEFKAFEATCTHEGSPLTGISGGDIICPRHGSRFSIEDGSVDNPPARAALPSVAITVTDGEIFLS